MANDMPNAKAFETLRDRFAHMAKVRRDGAMALRRANRMHSSIGGLEAAAYSYERCAEEITAVLNGAEPPPPGAFFPTDEKAAA